jgi:uncharacterized membrane protein YuzA (DUF378 family)
MAVILCSIHCVSTGLLTFFNETLIEKLAGKFAFLSALLSARVSGTEAVPLIAGMVTR